MSYYSETDKQQRRSEFVRNAKGASKQGVTIEQRDAVREQRADAWARWLHDRMDARGGEAIQHLPDALAELETRIDDQIAAAMHALKTALGKALR